LQSLSTPHCTQAAPGKPLIQYALMLDAGSTGSRIHVYRFNYCNDAPQLESEEFHEIKPGLSAYGDNPVQAAYSLDPLMELAMEHVPEGLQACTPISLKATAGLRLLGKDTSDAILASVQQRLRTAYPFEIATHEGVAVMDGRDEGVYAWITVNYLLGNLAHAYKVPTAAIMDLGGGSTQIVFEPAFPSGHALHPGEHRYELEFNSHHYILYQHSYLGYGLMEARKKTKMAAVAASPQRQNPCVSNGTKEDVWLADGTVVPTIGSANSMERCKRLIVGAMFDKLHHACPIEPCSFAGVYQPSMTDTFPHADVYAFSYVYDRLTPLGVTEEFHLSRMKSLVQDVCTNNLSAYPAEAMEEYRHNPDYCLDMAYIYALLKDGYDIQERRTIKTAKKINDIETGWCLGAALAMLDHGHYCKVERLL
jgi:guanosine-diphosphatase